MRALTASLCLAAFVVLLTAIPSYAGRAPGGSRAIVIPTGETPEAWKAVPADGVSLAIGAETGARGPALRLDFDFHGGGGYAVAHRAVSLDLPANYRFTYRVRGQCERNNLEFKLLDASGENVWWSNQREFDFPPDGREVTLRKRHISFAWGPRGGGEPGHIAGLEFAITAGKGGRGTVWIEDLRLEALPPPDTTAHTPKAAATSGRTLAPLAVDGDPGTAWSSDAKDARPTLTIDLGAVRELGGLVIDWREGRHARDYAVELSNGRTWRTAHEVRGGNGGRDYVYLPESEARFVRIVATRPVHTSATVAIASVEVKPLEWSATMDQFLAAIARDAPRGTYPRATLGENIFWTVVGVNYEPADALIDEVGRIETGRGAYSIEPFVRDRGRLVTWNDVTARPSLRGGYLPIPSVEWQWGDQRLEVTAIPAGTAGHSGIVASYRLRNLGAVARRETLYLALRPFQVNPPSQFLNMPGGSAPIREISFEGRSVRVNGGRGLQSLNEPSGAGAAAFDQGDIVEYLREGRLPPSGRTPDTFARASGALAYELDVPAGGDRVVALRIPLNDVPEEPVFIGDETIARAYLEGVLQVAEQRWRRRQDAVTIALPDSEVVRALKAQLAWVLVNRAGPAIQPGTRSYARSWIRDGCLTSSALLRLGETETVRQFIEWFAPHQYANGKAPCCVDSRGADPTPEHDSSGELIFLIAEYVRFTGDGAFAERMWPHVSGAAAYLDTLRAQRRSAEWRTRENARFFGLLPPSISHEGYSAKPMHSYWDDLFALRGFKDAVWLASLLGRAERGGLERDRDEFARDLAASIAATMKEKGIPYVPGCADLGDFDATSTSIAFNPVEAGEVVPRAALEATYERYWDFFAKRRDGRERWEAFTPYEWRNVGAMVRLGAGLDSTWRARAYEALSWFMGFRRPPGFQHWAEVVWHDERAPRFIGDMPHTWVGTDYVRTVLDMLAYEDEADSSLVIGAGVPVQWLADSGVVVRNLVTRWGPISFTMRGEASKGVATLEGEGFRMPPGGIVLRPPGLPGFRGPRGMGGSALRVPRLPFTMSWGDIAASRGSKPPAPSRSSGSPRGSTRRSP